MSDLYQLNKAATALSSAAYNIENWGDSPEADRAIDHIRAAEHLLQTEIKRIS